MSDDEASGRKMPFLRFWHRGHGPVTRLKTCFEIKRNYRGAWLGRIRTGESGREPPDWNCVTTWPEVGASRAAETCSRSSCNEGICSSGQDRWDAAYRVVLSFAT